MHHLIRIIAVRTGIKYSQWYEDNLIYMIDNYSKINYDMIEVIRDDKFDDERGVFNKLQMFDKFTESNITNLYFDLDVCIKNDCNYFLKSKFTLCHAWWRDPHHTPLNSSIMSWKGDCSYIYKKFIEDPEYYMFKYYRGIDQFIYENIKYNTYKNKSLYYSFREEPKEKDASICLFNQRYEYMKNKGWWSNYFLQKS